MERTYKLFGKHSFRRSIDGNRKPINKSLFEMWGGLLSKLPEDEFSSVLKNKRKLIREYGKIINDQDFEIAISRSSMKHLAVQYRFSEILNLINRIKND